MKPEPLKGKIRFHERFKPDKNVFFWREDVKSACEFYLKYKNNPELLTEEHPEMDVKKEWIDDFKMGVVEEEYNEWLFKLAFEDMVEP